jgi:Tol biopolymer transport system component
VPGDNLSYTSDGRNVAWVRLGDRSLWRSRDDGSEAVQITPPGYAATSPRWSPDGKTIAFARWQSAGAMRIYTVPAAGGSPKDPIPGEFDQANPNWTNGGAAIVFAGAPWLHGFATGATSIRRFELATGRVTNLPGGDNLWSPKVSPDGKWIAAEELDSRRIRLFDAAAGRWSDLIAAPGVIGYPCWSHDSRYLYFNIEPTHFGPAAVYRVDIERPHLEQVADLREIKAAGTLSDWFGLTPTDEMLILRERETPRIFALDVAWQ